MVINPVKEGVGTLIYAKSTKRYLFLLRNHPKQQSTWGIVGGKIDAGETVMQALHREIQEEISKDFSHQKFIPIETFTSDNERFIYYTFVTTVEEEFSPVLNHEHRGYCWVELRDHPKPLHPGVWRTFNFSVVKKKIKTLESILN
jgi:8-oxo-dGTP pyrophosphatase MutT (NUDIX family)